MADSRRSCGVDLLEAEDDVVTPFCPHGPTIQFVRYFEKKSPRRFFACASCRDRKECSFFCWSDEKITEEKRKRWFQLFKDSQPICNRVKLMKKLSTSLALDKEDRRFCHTCGVLVLPEEAASHSSHQTSAGVEQQLLSLPTRLITPNTQRKSHAQFFYNQKTMDFLCNEIKRQGFTHCVCLGVPRLHEHLLSQHGSWASSFLLDIDHKFAQFYGAESFQRHNMLNGYFYEEGGQDKLRSFAPDNRGHIVLVVDPPFGALAGLLARHIKSLWTLLGKEVKTIITFPYFLEGKLVEHLPDVAMSDYQVCYDNHPVFNDSRSARPSAARFFTNFSPPGMKLFKKDGYQFCSLCCKYTAKNNQHCHICNCCPSKDGRIYVHCDLCKSCVKPGRVHCSTCDRCDLPGHTCLPGEELKNVCHICHQYGHKRRDCPLREKSLQLSKPRKRSSQEGPVPCGKRKAVAKKSKSTASS